MAAPRAWRWLAARVRGQRWPATPAIAVALLAGVVAALWSPWLLPVAAYCSLLLIAVPLCLHGRAAALLAICLAGVGWAGWTASQVLARQLPAALERHDLRVRGSVEGLPQAEARRTRFLLRVDDDADQPEALRGRLLQVAWYDDFGAHQIGPRAALAAGMRWEMQLRLRAPRGLRNPGGFDAERFALANRIVASASVRSPQSARVLQAPRGIDAWRDAMSARLGRRVASEASPHLRALALGDTRYLQDRDWQTLRSVGLTHLIAISGFHVGLVAGGCALLVGGLWWLLPPLARWLPRLHASALGGACGAAGYALLAGLSLPTVRTVLMIAVAMLACLLRRRGGVVQALALTLLAVLLFDPLSVLLAGFWLSFAGVAWLVWCLPGRLPLWKAFLMAQAVATIALVPLTLAMFDQVSLVGPLANLLAIPWWSLVVVPLALVGTALEALVDGAGVWAWQLAAWCFEPSWALFTRLGDSDIAAWWAPEAGATALVLAMLGAFWLLMPRGTPARALGLLLWLPLCLPQRELSGDGEVDLQVLDVGQGLAVLVRTRGHALLYDAGPAVAEGFDAGERVVVPALRASGVRQLDVLLISHADADHAGGMAAVQAAIPARRVLAPPDAPLAPHAPCERGQAWRWDGVDFRILHPTSGFPYLRNDSSCVLRIETAHGAALLTGDIGKVVEQRLLRMERPALRADVVLAPHHGSAGSSDPALVNAAGARLAVMSTGHGNRFGHPRADVVQRWRAGGAEVLDTASSGAIRMWLTRDGLQVRERRRWMRRLWDAAERHRPAAILSGDEHAAGVPGS